MAQAGQVAPAAHGVTSTATMLLEMSAPVLSIATAPQSCSRQVSHKSSDNSGPYGLLLQGYRSIGQLQASIPEVSCMNSHSADDAANSKMLGSISVPDLLEGYVVADVSVS